MMNSSHLFLILTIIAGILGFAALENSAAGVAQALFAMFLVLTLTSVTDHEIQRREH